MQKGNINTETVLKRCKLNLKVSSTVDSKKISGRKSFSYAAAQLIEFLKIPLLDVNVLGDGVDNLGCLHVGHV